jgi:hypothetical protein
MNAAEVVIGEVKAVRSPQVVPLLRKRIRQPGQPTGSGGKSKRLLFSVQRTFQTLPLLAAKQARNDENDQIANKNAAFHSPPRLSSRFAALFAGSSARGSLKNHFSFPLPFKHFRTLMPETAFPPC